MIEHENESYDGKASSGESKSPGELNFHYDREERLKGLSFEYPRRKTRGIFRSNKGLTFILLDVLILLLIGFIFVPFMRGRLSVETWKGYRLELEATSFDDKVFAKLIVRDEGEGEFPGELIEVVFVYGEETLGESLTEFFPESNGKETAVRTSYPADPGAKSVSARVTHGNEMISLDGRIR